ncbi:MAG: helix-turn-helix transcriptional regulator [Bacilli bacterium]|nr:helix-turn-helix transcriptional regulator [Bacilli bacterium]
MMKEISQLELGKRIKSAREKLNMSQFSLYEKTGISTTQISAYENGKKSLGLQTLAKIASALGLSLDELYYGSASSKPISASANKGELIVNCIYALYEEGVIRPLIRQEVNEYVGMGAEYYYRIGFSEFVDVLDDLVRKLKDFQDNKDNYPDPDSFKNQLLAAAAKQINKQSNND